MEIIALIPASGLAARLGNIPTSKEVFPYLSKEEKRIKVLSEDLVDTFKTSGIKKAYFIVRKGKWDIPEYYGSGENHGMDIGYLIMNQPYGVPFTLNQAYPFVQDKIVALGFPDMKLRPIDCYKQLYKKMEATGANLVLGIFPVPKPEKWDMTITDDKGRVTGIYIKQPDMKLTHGWSIALWKPHFTEYMHRFVENLLKKGFDGTYIDNNGRNCEFYPGHIMQAYIDDGHEVQSVVFDQGESTDMGTLDDLKTLM